MTNPVREESSLESRVNKVLTDSEINFIQGLKPFQAESSAGGLSPGDSSGKSPEVPGGNFLPIAGGRMVGALGFTPEIVTIASGIIDVGQLGNFRGHVILISESGFTDDLIQIDGGSADMQTQWLQVTAAASHTITIKHHSGGTGNGKTRTPDGSDFVLVSDADNERSVFLYYDVTNDEWALMESAISTMSGGGGTVPAGSAVNDHLQWNGSAWVVTQTLNYDNDVIAVAMRNAANDGDLEIKATTSDFFDFTLSSNGSVVIQLRAQHAVDADKILSITQDSGSAGEASYNTGTQHNFDVGATNVLSISASGLEMLGGLDIEMNQGQIQNMTALVFEGFSGTGRSISEFATGIHYDIENAAHSHVFRVLGNPPAEVFRIDNDQIVASQDFNFQGNLLLGTERADPSTPAANTGVFYIKDAGGVSTPFFMGDDGVAVDLTTGSGFANTSLSNLTATAINTGLVADNNGFRDLGSFSFHWDHVYSRAIVFGLENKVVDATETSIGANATSLWFNQTNVTNSMSWRWDDVQVMGLTTSGILSLQGTSGTALMQLINTTATQTIFSSGHNLQFTNDGAVANKTFIFGGIGADEGERILLTGTGGTNTEFRFGTDQATATNDIAKIIFEGHDDGGIDTDYASIVGQVISPTSPNEAGALVLRVADSVDGQNTTYMTLNGSSQTIRVFKELNIDSNKIANIGTATITDLTEELVPAAGDFIMGFEATSGAMRKFDVGNLPGGGGGVSFPITPTINNLGTVTTDRTGGSALDVSATTGHVHKFTVGANIQVDFTGFPAANTQIEWEVEVKQDSTGNRIITWDSAVIETVTISATPDSITIITFRTNDAGATIHAIPALRGSIDLSSGSFLPLSGGTMTGAIAMSGQNISDIGVATIDTLFIENLGAGINPSFTSNSASQTMSLTGNFFISGNLDMNGGEIIVDADGDTTIGDGGTDDVILFTLGATGQDFLMADGSFAIEDAYIQMSEITTGGTVPANAGRLYVKEVSGTHAELFYKDELGTETNLVTVGGGTGDIIQEGNSSVEVIDTGIGNIVFTVDAIQQGDIDQGNGWTFDNDITANNAAFFNANVTLGNTSADKVLGNALVQRDWSPFDNITWNLGESAKMWAALFVRNVRFNASTAFINYVSPTMAFEVPSTEFFNWEVGNVLQMTLTASDLDIHGNTLSGLTTLNWDDGNSIASTPSDFRITLPTATDPLLIQYGGTTKITMSQDGIDREHPLVIRDEVYRNDASPSDFDVLHQRFVYGNDSSAAKIDYFVEQVTEFDSTSTSKDTDLQYIIYSNNTQVNCMQFTGSASSVHDGILMGFRNAVPVIAPTYTVTNGVTDRSYDANSTSVAELADILFTLLQDLDDMGIVLRS